MGNQIVNLERTCIQCAATCVKATGDAGGCKDLFPEDSVACEPVGTIFDETLEDLADMDRNLLLFSSGTNLAGVRWLLLLGADKDTADLNGTGALHAACRTGSLSIVQELVMAGVPLDVSDSHGWTPLHVAITMNRRAAVLYLLEMEAPVSIQTNSGQTPLDMCRDPWLCDAIHSFIMRKPRQKISNFREVDAASDNVCATRLEYEPFFVPRAPVIQQSTNQHAMKECGQSIFEKKPGQGLAFLVAAGCVRDYPVDICVFLRRCKLDREKMGMFLGESFSLAQVLRLEFINSIRLVGTSLVGSLIKVFTLLKIPKDLQKIDRLVHGVAVIWWRQHQRAKGEGVELDPTDDKQGKDEELQGFSLKSYLTSPDALYQLMFSAVMLHFNLFAPVGMSARLDKRLSQAQWIEINRGLEADGRDLPMRVLQGTFQTISSGFVPQLAMSSTPLRGVTSAWAPKADASTFLRNASTKEDWAVLTGTASTNSPYRDSRMVSVVNDSVMDGPPMAKRLAHRWDRYAAGDSGPRLDREGQDRVWMSLYYSVLFLSKAPTQDEAPYAFINLRRLRVQRNSDAAGAFTLRGPPKFDPVTGEPNESADMVSAESKDRTGNDCPLVVVFLLPDGRWQERPMVKLDVQLIPSESDADEESRLTEKWVAAIHAASVMDEPNI